MRLCRGETVLVYESALPILRQLDEIRLQSFEELARGHEDRQVGLWEIAVVTGGFLSAHCLGDVAVLVPEASLLDNTAPIHHDFLLSLDLEGERLAHEAGGIHVLDLDLRPGRGPSRRNGDVRIATEGPLFHVAVARAQVADEPPQLQEQHLRLRADLEVRLGHDLEKRRSGAVEVEERDVAGVDHLARVLFEMDFVDSNAPPPLVHLNVDVSVPANGSVELTDLVVLRQVRVEVVLSGKCGPVGKIAVQRPGDQVGQADRLVVEGRKGSGIPKADRADVGVRLSTEVRGTATEDL